MLRLLHALLHHLHELRSDLHHLHQLRSVLHLDHFIDYCQQGKRSYYIASTFEDDPYRAAPQLDHDGSAEPFDHGGVETEFLVRVGARSPRGGISLDGQQVFRGVRNTVQTASIMPGSNFLFRRTSLREAELSRDGDIGVELRVQPLAEKQRRAYPEMYK